MKPYIHFIPCPDEEEQVIDLIKTLRMHDEEIKLITKNANKFVKIFLTEKAQIDYVYNIIYAYADNYPPITY